MGINGKQCEAMRTPLQYRGDVEALLNTDTDRLDIKCLQQDVRRARSLIKESFTPPRPKYNFTALEQLRQTIWVTIGNQYMKNDKYRILALNKLPMSLCTAALHDLFRRKNFARQLKELEPLLYKDVYTTGTNDYLQYDIPNDYTAHSMPEHTNLTQAQKDHKREHWKY